MILSSNWFTEPAFDFEYKKYQLLAYLQQKNKVLQENKIFPHLDELNEHESALESFLRHKNEMDDSFKKILDGIDETTGELKYHSSVNGEENIGELMEIVCYSHRKMKICRNDFSEHAEEFQKEIRLELSGLLPSWVRDGFLIVYRKSDTHLFSYESNPVLNASGEIRFHYHFLQQYPSGIVSSEQTIKSDILKFFARSYDHPAVFAVITNKDLPVYETVLPLTGNELKKWVM